MKLKNVIVLASMGFALALQAVEITSDQARTAARNWVRRSPARMGATFRSSNVESSETFRDSSGRPICHAVNFKGGGFVVTSADTEINPVIAFSDSGALDISDDNPFLAILKADMRGRVLAADDAARSFPSGSRLPVSKCHETGWAELIALGDGDRDSRQDGEPEDPAVGIGELDDVRVAPMVRSEWNQSGTWNGNYIYNMYTPNHYFCGCTATAVAQVMRYWEYPRTYLSKRTVECKVDSVPANYTTIGGTYNWSDMPLTGADITSVSQCEMIGRLTYDVGVISGMNWKKSGSGAGMLAAANGLVGYFEYANADAVNAGAATGNLVGSSYANGVLGSLDAGMPAVLAVYKRDGDDYTHGHSVVADGYGYSGDYMYLHINVGYSRKDWNIWYNMFGEAVVAGSHEWDYVWTSIVNIHPTVAGHVVSGRVLSSAGVPVSGATVRLYNSSSIQVASTATNAKGIYSFRISTSGQYAVAASKGSGASPSVSVDMLDLPVGGSYERGGDTGNKWGVDLTLEVNDEWDPGDDTASGGTWLAPATAVQTHGQHTLSSTDLCDFFRISMTAGWTYVFETTGADDTYGELYKSTTADSSGRVDYNDDGGDGGNFKLTYTPSSSGTYYLRVRQYSGQNDSYFLKYSCSSPQPATYLKVEGCYPHAYNTLPSDAVDLADARVECDGVWSVSLDDTSWGATLKTTGGSGDGYFYFSAPQNTGYNRRCVFTVSSGSFVAYKHVTQYGPLGERPTGVKVTFGKNGGTGGSDSVSAVNGQAMPAATAPTLSGWTFGGYWDTLALDEKGNPKGKQYYDANMKSVRNWDKASTATLWAKWTNKVTLGKNGGTGGDSYVTCTRGQPMPKRTMPTKTGYVFDGYWTTTGAGGVKYYNADGTSAHAWDKSGNVTLWAKWVKPVACKVTFGKNGGTGGDDYVTATTGQPMPTPRTAPKRTGWTFGGYWDTLACDAKGNPLGKQYYDASMKSVRAWDKTSAATLWAKWTVRVKLGKNGGTGGDDYVTVIYNQPFPKRTMPKRSGYAFGGYFMSASSKTGQCYNPDGTGTSSMKWSTGGSPTIWALWTKTSACVELPPAVARRAAAVAVSAPSASAAPAPEVPAIPAGIYSGVLADGSGAFWLVLDEAEKDAPRTAFLYVASEDGSLTAECTAEEADGVLFLTTEDGNTYLFDIAGGALGDRALPCMGE